MLLVYFHSECSLQCNTMSKWYKESTVYLVAEEPTWLNRIRQCVYNLHTLTGLFHTTSILIFFFKKSNFLTDWLEAISSKHIINFPMCYRLCILKNICPSVGWYLPADVSLQPSQQHRVLLSFSSSLVLSVSKLYKAQESFCSSHTIWPLPFCVGVTQLNSTQLLCPFALNVLSLQMDGENRHANYLRTSSIQSQWDRTRTARDYCVSLRGVQSVFHCTPALGGVTYSTCMLRVSCPTCSGKPD